jgi:transposase
MCFWFIIQNKLYYCCIAKRKHSTLQIMPTISLIRRQEFANRVNGGQSVKKIALAMGVSLSTAHRLKAQFSDAQGVLTAVPGKPAFKEKISREQLLALSEMMKAAPKITLEEMQLQAVEERIFRNADTVPSISALSRALRRVGFKWQKPKYVDKRSKRTAVQWERCDYKRRLDAGLDPTTILSMDETNFYYEQATRSWGTTYQPAKLEKPKGKVPRRSMYATIGFTKIGGKFKAFIHWVLIPPRRSWRPLGEAIEKSEQGEFTRAELKRLTGVVINGLTLQGLKDKLKELGVRSENNTADSMRTALKRIGQRGSRVGELRARKGPGRPSKGGALTVFTGDARIASEYLHQCLLPYMNSGELWSPQATECKLTMDEGIRGCPDGGKREYNIKASDTTLQWDNAPSHLAPKGSKSVGGFHLYAKEVLGLKSLLHTPPYTPTRAPIEAFFSLVKRYCRKFTCSTTAELLKRIREATAKISGKDLAHLFKWAGYILPGEQVDWRVEGEEEKKQPDPCTLPRDHRFPDRRLSVVCVDKKGDVIKEKKTGHQTWSKWKDQGGLKDMSVTKASGVRKKRKRVTKCAEPEEGEKRYVGLGKPPAGMEVPGYDDLFQNADDQAEVEAILKERQKSTSSKHKGPTPKEYLVKFRGVEKPEWVPQEAFSTGLDSAVSEYKQRAERAAYRRALAANAAAANKEYVPNRTPAIGKVVALLAAGSKELFFVGKILKVKKDIMTVHWYDSRGKKLDGVWQEDFESKQGKGVGKAYTSEISTSAIIDEIKSMAGKKKGKIAGAELKRLLQSATESSEKQKKKQKRKK